MKIGTPVLLVHKAAKSEQLEAAVVTAVHELDDNAPKGAKPKVNLAIFSDATGGGGVRNDVAVPHESAKDHSGKFYRE